MNAKELQPPAGWPEGVPLPTIEETNEAVRRVGESIAADQQADLRDRIAMAIALGEDPLNDDNPTVTI